MGFAGLDEEWIKTNLGNISSNEMYGMNSVAKEYDGFNKYIRITDISETSNKFVPNPLTSPDGELDPNTNYKMEILYLQELVLALEKHIFMIKTMVIYILQDF